jgi:hypothetical protein
MPKSDATKFYLPVVIAGPPTEIATMLEVKMSKVEHI